MNILTQDIALSDLISLEQAGYEYADFLRPITKDHVEHLIVCQLEGVPPIDVIAKDSQFVILNGYHRIEAAKGLKRATIPAIVHQFSEEREVLTFAFQANLNNGLPLSRKEKEAYIVYLTNEYPELSQADIARKVKVNPSTVSKLLKRLDIDTEDTSQKKEDRAYSYANRDYGKRLYKALIDFYEHESATWRGKGSTKSEDKRATLLVHVAERYEDIQKYESLARSLLTASKMLNEESEKE